VKINVWDFGLIRRYWHANPARAGASFSSTVERWAQESDCTVIALDSRGRTWRHSLFPEYKANRPELTESDKASLAHQQQIAIERLVAQGIRIRSAEGYEADDVIATVARQAIEAGHHVLVFSGDKDLAQLLPTGIGLHDARVYVSAADVEAKFGVKVEQLVDYFAIAGDRDDNVKGAPGLGPAAARKILSAHPSVRIAIETGRRRVWDKLLAKLVEHEQEVLLALRLVRLDADAPVVKGTGL